MRVVAMISPFSSIAGVGLGIYAGSSIYTDMQAFWHEDAQHLCEKAQKESDDACFEEAMECLRIVYKEGITYSDPRRDVKLASCMQFQENPTRD